MIISHAQGRLASKRAPLQLDDRAAGSRCRPRPTSSIDQGGAVDAIEIVAGERLGLVVARERRRRRADHRHGPRRCGAPGQHVEVVVAVQDEFGAVPRQHRLQLGGVRRPRKRLAWPGSGG